MIAAGAMLVSCGSSTEEKAAEEYCGCVEGMLELQKEAGNADSAAGLFGASEEMMEEAEEMGKCLQDWQKEYEGKVDKDKLMEAIKESNADVYKMIEDAGGM